MIIVPFLPMHLEGLVLQEEQKEFAALIRTPGYGDVLMMGGPAFSGFVNGICVGCAGIADQGHRGLLWALLSQDCPMVAATKAVKRILSEHNYNYTRYEFVTKDIPSQHKWARMLGFTLETPHGMPKHWPDGETGYLYGRIK